ncbi:uncharacterized protein LOC114575361 [Exaiptasia diaphana]|uniref:DZIP3-like HEPN domain-containing protein n=1 Tax=Exaiptasia diaphana TaxID=2652724 RepID=A0A913YLH1_EXADI|nr:uncharacterized protein LOC114575361 [Exaiptasia diaphana]KXJ26120.1 Nephrocystin-3 [Exaiptasia diaphana]
MATCISSSSSSSSSTSAKCKTNYTRLLRLVVDIGSKVFREVLDAQLSPPADLQRHLNSSRVCNKLKTLRKKHLLKTPQWNMLYPPSPGVPSSTSFDITLLFLLLRNTCGLRPPATGWDAAPIEADKSPEADLIRVKQCRNEIICHKNAAELSDAEFETHWAEIESALIRLGGSQYEPEIQSLKIKSVDPDNELYLNHLLQSWEEGEDKKFDALKEDIEQLRAGLQSLRKDYNEDGRAQNLSEQLNSFCNLPQKPSHDVVNRHEEVSMTLKEIHELTKKYPDHVTVTYLSGNPGCGKSELARQVGEKHFDNFNKEESSKFVATLNGSNLETLRQTYMELADDLQCDKSALMTGLTAGNTSQEQKLIELKSFIITKVKRYSSWLMIVDNVEDVQMVSKFIPRSGDRLTHGKGHILITTQDKQSIPPCDTHAHHIQLSLGMNLHDAVQSLHTISRFSCNDEVAEKVCKKLDFQPLALACAAVYMRQTCYTDPAMNWERYLEEVEKGNTTSADEFYEKANLAYQRSMTTAVKMAVETIIDKSQVMLHTFEFMAAIAPEFISLDHVLNYVLQCTPERNKNSVAAEITSSSLIVTMRNGSKRLHIRIHQVFYHILQSVYQAKFWQPIDEFSFLMKFVEVFSYVKDMDKTALKFTEETGPLIPHFVYFSDKVKRYFERHEVVKVLNEANRYGVHYQSTKLFTHQYIPLLIFLTGSVSYLCEKHGKYGTTRALLEISYCLIDSAYQGSNHPDVAATLNSLGTELANLGEHNQAKHCCEKSLEITQSFYNSNHPEVAVTLNNLGKVLDNLGNYNEAKVCHEKALAIEKSTYGSNSPEVASTLNNLGTVLHNLGTLNQAKECYEKALAIEESNFGNNHPELASTLNNLGTILDDLGKHYEAQTCYEKALAIEETTYGSNHPEVAATLNNLGTVLDNLGKYEEALRCYLRALAIKVSTYGIHHPEVASTLCNLGTMLDTMGNFDDAKKCYEISLEIEESTYGRNHPEVASTLCNLGTAFANLGEFIQAKKCYLNALEIEEKTYGSNHIELATTLKNVGLVLTKLGKPDEAQEYFEKARKIEESN